MTVTDDDRLRALIDEQLKHGVDLTGRLRGCIEDLRKNGIELTIEQQLRVEAVFVASCMANGRVPAGDQLGRLIAPIAARSPEEQVTAQAVVASWFPETVPLAEPVPKAPSAPMPDEPGGAAEAAEAALADARRARDRRRQRNWLGAIAIVLVVTYALAQFLLLEFGPHPVDKQKPASTVSSAPSPNPIKSGKLRPVLPTAAPTTAPTPVPPPSTPVQGWFETLQQKFGAEAALIVMIPLIVLIVFLASTRRLLTAYARQARVVPKSEIRVRLADEAVRLEPDEPFLRRVQPLRRRVDTYSRELDIVRTLQATAARGGILTPVRAKRYMTPEYLVLIDDRGPNDHLSAYSSALVKALAQAGIAATVYRFDRDPRRVYLGPGQRALDIRDLATLFSTHRLFVFSDGVGWIDPATGRPHEWTQIFAEWDRRFLFTWKDPKDWSVAEIAFERRLDFAVLPATQEGLTIAAESFEHDGDTLPEAAGTVRAGRETGRLIDTFGVARWRWLDSHAPPSTDARDLVFRLRKELSPQAFSWLCAAAVYPAVSWSLTIFLGARLSPPGPFDDTWRAALLEISRLPWLHAGRMPRWLRELLIEELGDDQRTLVYNALESLFLTDTTGRTGDTLVLGHGALDRDGADRDYILVDFLSRGKATSADFRLRAIVLRNLGLIPSRTQRIVFGRGDLKAARTSADSLRAFLAEHPPAAIAAQSRARGALGIGVADVVAWRDTGGADQALPTPLVLLDDEPKGRAMRVVDDRTATIWKNRKRLALAIAALGPLAFAAAFLFASNSYFSGTDFLTELLLAFALFYAPGLLAWLSVFLPMRMEIRRFPRVPVESVQLAPSEAPLVADGTTARVARFATVPFGIVAAIFGISWALNAHLFAPPPPVGTIVLRGDTSGVESGAYSPDGSHIVTASDDHSVRIWDARTGAQLALLKGHTDLVKSAMYSPDGARIVSGSFDNTVRIWDAASGAQLLVMSGHESGVSGVAYSPDGKHVVSGSGDNTVRIWDAVNGKAVAVLKGHTDWVNGVAYSPDGKRIVSGSDDHTVRVWDAATGNPIAVLKGHTNDVYSVGYSPDGRHIISASWDKTVRIWDATTFAQVAVLNGNSSFGSAWYSPDGKRIVTASYDDTVQVWDASTDTALATLTGHTDAVNWAVFSPNGYRIVSTSEDHTGRIWDTPTGKSVPGVPAAQQATSPPSVADEPTPGLLPAAIDASLILRGHTDVVWSSSFSPDGRRVVSGSRDKTVRLWDATTGAQQAVLRGHTNDVISTAFSPDGKRVVSASWDKTSRVWDAASGAQLAVMHDADRDWSAAFSPDGSKIVTASDNGAVRVWNASTGAPLLTLTGHTKAANSAAFSPDGRRIVSGSDDQTVRVWDASTGAQLQLLRGHTDDVLSVAFSPDGSRILSSGADDTARVWDASTGASIAVMRGDTDWLRHAAFSPDGKHVVSASDDKSVRVWDAASGAQLALIDGHTDAVNWAAYSPDGARIVSASDDRTVRIWDAAKAMTAVAAPAALQTNSPERNRIVGTWKAKWGTEFTFTADGKASNTAGHSGTWTYDGGQNYTETYTPGGAGNVWKLAMAPDGKSYIITNETGAPEDNRVLKQ